MIQKAVIDRIIDGKKAVLLVGDEEKELIIEVKELPANAVEGAWVRVYENGKIEIDEQETTDVKSRINDKLARLKSRSNSSIYKKK